MDGGEPIGAMLTHTIYYHNENSTDRVLYALYFKDAPDHDLYLDWVRSGNHNKNLGGILMLNEYNSIKCGSCGRRVAETAYTCPGCGHDVRALKSRGNGCWNCEATHYCDKEYGPAGYPCLAWEENATGD